LSRPGRRPGKADTRAHILEAARESFAEHGYSRASLRGIARRAEVDPALVHHYFACKAELFIEAVRLPVDPRAVQEAAAESTAPGPRASFSGARVVEGFLTAWDRGGAGGASFVTLAQAMCASPEAADSMREFLDERVWRNLELPGPQADSMWRRSLVSSQLAGLAWARYVLRVEPLASATPAEVAEWAGPVIDWYAAGRAPAGA
jgi:AcrR family transcriptional regulator